MTSRFMLIFAAISGFIFNGSGCLRRACLKSIARRGGDGSIHTGRSIRPSIPRAIFGLAVAMQRRISIWFYWSSVFLALGTVLFSGSLYCWRSLIYACGRS